LSSLYNLTPTLSFGEGAKKIEKLQDKVLSFGEDLGEVY